MTEDRVHGMRDLLGRYYHKHCGERCFVLGNGPSLNKLDLSKLSDEWLFGCNCIYLKRDELERGVDYYFLVDTILAPQIQHEVNEYLSHGDIKVLFLHSAYTDIIHDNGADVIVSQWSNVVQSFSNTGTLMVIIAAYMGFNPVYMIGMDANYDGIVDGSRPIRRNVHTLIGDDQWHFDPNYSRKPDGTSIEFIFGVDEASLMLAGFDRAYGIAAGCGCSVFNAGVDSRLQIFEKVDYESLF